MNQFLRNQIHQRILTELGAHLFESGAEVVPLKGASLISRVYSDTAERFQSDLDLLLAEKGIVILSQYLKKRDFSSMKKDALSQHKQVWRGIFSDIEITIELHSRLFSEEPPDWKWPLVKTKRPGISLLDIESELFFLIHHLAYQHNFLKLFWLRDISLFLDKFGRNLNEKTVWEMAQLFRRKNSLKAVVNILRSYGPQSARACFADLTMNRRDRQILKELLPARLWKMRQKKWNYFLNKHLIKDSLIEALNYDLIWFLDFCRK